MRTATFVCVGAAFVSVLALNGTVDAKVAPVRGAVCVQSGAKAREAVSGRGLVCVRTKTGVLRWRLQPKKTRTTTPTTVAPKAYRIGDLGPAGGTIFITPSTVGNSTGLYFEVAPRASRRAIFQPRGDNGGLSVPSATGKAIGDGAANTAAIARQVGNVAESSAAVYASEYSLNGFSDWFLPSKDELNEMYKYRDSLGGFGLGYYLSSSDTDFHFAWAQVFFNGNQLNVGKIDFTFYVRPVRAFP